MAFEVEEPFHLDSWWIPIGQKLFDKECTGDDDWMDEQVEPLFKMLSPKLKTHLAKGGSTSDLSWSTLRQWLPEQGFSSTAKKPTNTLRLLYKRCVEYEKHEHDKVVMPAPLLPSASCHAAQAVACPAWMKKPGVYAGRNRFNSVKFMGKQCDGKA